MSAQLKAAKDALVSSLYELSKAATEASSATVDFYNASLVGEEDSARVFAELAGSLRLLTQSALQIHGSAQSIINEANLADVADPALLSLEEHLNGVEQDVKQKKKAEKDPFAPKKPLTVFFAYSSYVRESIRDEKNAEGGPPLSSTEITQVISERWNSLTDLEKAKWKYAYGVELALYQARKEKYLEDKKNGLEVNTTVPTTAPVPIPAEFLVEKTKKRTHDGEKEKEKKKKKNKKKHSHQNIEPSSDQLSQLHNQFA